MRILHKIAYHGKTFDTLSSSISIVLHNIGFKIPAFVDCFCLRPFIFKFDLNDYSLWFSPLIKTSDALNIFAKLFRNILDINIFDCSIEKRENDCCFSVIDKMLLTGHVIVGPLDKSKIWNRIESLYFKGGEYYIVIVDKKGENYVINDPLGCPFSLYSKNIIYNSMLTNTLIFQFKIIDFNYKNENLHIRTLYEGIKYRNNNINNLDSLPIGLSKLLEKGELKLKSSQIASLSFGIPNYSLFLMQLSLLFQNIIENTYSFDKKLLIKAEESIEKYKLILAELLFSIQNNIDLIASFEQLIFLESEFTLQLNRMSETIKYIKNE
ncbi:hypothetical protein [Bacteroides sp. 519]|uniref:hypothetical protein n=1 Tax=Bacteroides sp. 519 TaxID=2302937 RepID=UPI0013D455FE|nr:hypothetical protein [Bacteroides sp. 519]NDV57971.1 hypothetical protein [Bacteroides sp. 519]